MVGASSAFIPAPLTSGPISDVADASRPSVSGDGRWVVFQGDDEGRLTVYRSDRTTGATVELSPVPDGARSGDTVNPVLSADGCVVVAQTEMALDLFRDDDTGERWDVYRLVVPECGGEPGRWELVSTGASSGTARDDVDVTSPPTVNESGALVAFTHPMSGRRSGVTTISTADLTVPIGQRDRVVELPAMPVEAPTGAFRYRGAMAPALSGDGRHLAFVSDATSHQALPEWGTGPVTGEWATSQVYVWDRDDPERLSHVQLASARDGQPSVTGAWAPAISRDGRVVVFESIDTSLVDAIATARCDEVCPTQIFRVDRDLDGSGDLDLPENTSLTMVSAVDDGSGVALPGDASSWSPTVNVDGSQVAFVSRATNLLPTRVARAGSELDGEIIVAEIPLGGLRRVTDAAERGAIAAAHARPALSATGRVVVFETAVPGAFAPGEIEGRRIVAVVSTPVLSLAELDFGTVLTGWASDELWVSVLNEGPGAFTPEVITSTSPNFRVLDGGTCTRGLVVPAGGTCTVHVSFTPTASVDFSGTLLVSELEAAGEPTDPFTDSLTGSLEAPHAVLEPTAPSPALPSDASSVTTRLAGQGGDPVLVAEPGALDLGSGTVGTPGERRAFDIRNVSFAPTRITALSIGGAHPDDFTVTAESCTDRALNPNATCGVEIEFAPTAAQRRTGSLLVTTDSGGYTAAIVGGVGRFAPEVVLAEPSVTTGGQLGIGLMGFAPDTDVTLTFADSTRVVATLRTDASGSVIARVDVSRRERGGERRLVASGEYGAVASVPVVIERPLGPAPGLPGHGLG